MTSSVRMLHVDVDMGGMEMPLPIELFQQFPWEQQEGPLHHFEVRNGSLHTFPVPNGTHPLPMLVSTLWSWRTQQDEGLEVVISPPTGQSHILRLEWETCPQAERVRQLVLRCDGDLIDTFLRAETNEALEAFARKLNELSRHGDRIPARYIAAMA